MVLTVDIGNTQTLLGVFSEEKLILSSRISTDKGKTADEYAVILKSILSIYKISHEQIDGAIISSVVPQVLVSVKKAINILTKIEPLVVGPGVKTSLNIKIDNPAQLGADLVCVSVAAKEKYPLPSVVIDLGTATTISALDRDGNMVGCSILPGIRTSLDALSQRTAQLPQISLDGKVPVIGTNTIDSMRSGSILGTAAMIDGMVDRYSDILGQGLTVIATGGLSASIIPHCRKKILLDSDLLIDGLFTIYKRNK